LEAQQHPVGRGTREGKKGVSLPSGEKGGKWKKKQTTFGGESNHGEGQLDGRYPRLGRMQKPVGRLDEKNGSKRGNRARSN